MQFYFLPPGLASCLSAVSLQQDNRATMRIGDCAARRPPVRRVFNYHSLSSANWTKRVSGVHRGWQA